MSTTTKQKSIWACTSCGHQQPKWSGQCPSCKAWNSLHEEVQVSPQAIRFAAQKTKKKSQPIPLNQVAPQKTPRVQTDIQELDRVLGGGLVPGSFTLIGGDPGIGKSTFMLQTSFALTKKGLKILYVCGEESVEQTSLRAQRLGIASEQLFLLNETNFSQIKHAVDQIQPDVLIVDSIQIIYKEEISSAPGSVAQVRETAAELMHLAKGENLSTFIIGHVTKSGEIAGPRVLEHLVDTVLYFEGDKQNCHRILRSIKNRFGPTDEVALFSMESSGLREIQNPSEIFLEQRKHALVGCTVIPTLEGSRPILVEAQALVTQTSYQNPSRKSTGLDSNRLALLLAVLEKRLQYKMFHCDVFVSVAGGIKIQEPAMDLGIVLAIASSFNNVVIPSSTLSFGEVGLGGEIRSVPKVENRLKEAVQLGFERAIIPKQSLSAISKQLQSSLTIIGADFVEEAIEYAFRS